MLVVIIAPVHVWDDVRVFKKEAVSLARSGFNVKLIARADKHFFSEGIEIIPPAGNHKNRFLRFISLPLIFLQALKLKANIYHLHNPDTIPIAFFLKIFRRKVIYDTHEDFTKRILTRSWLPSAVRKPLAIGVGYAESLVSSIVNFSIATQPDVCQRLGKKSLLLENLPRFNKELINTVTKNIDLVQAKGNEFRLIYIGAISVTRGLFEMVDALEIINKKTPCRLWLIGTGNLKEIQVAKKRAGWGFVDYFPRMNQEMAFAYVAASDAGLIYIRNIGGHSEIDPNKIYEYMALSVPFIASDFKKWRKKFDSVNAGIFIEPEDVKKLAIGVTCLASMPKDNITKMGKNGKEFILENNWEKESKKLIDVYKNI